MSHKVGDSEVAAVDMFCGVGGLTYGLQRSGVRVVAGYDIDPDCEYPFSYNTGVPFHRRDVNTVTSEELAPLLGVARFSLLAGCAPCQPFSTYSRTRTSEDGRWSLVKGFLKHVTSLAPDVVTMENVPQFTRHPVFSNAVRTLERHGYSVTWSIVDCVAYSVPQTRQRLVLLASRHGPIQLLPPRISRPRTVRDVLQKLPPIAAGGGSIRDPLHRACSLSELNMRRIKASNPGGSWRDWRTDLRAECHRRARGATFPSVYARMEWDAPAPTMTTQYFGFGNGRFGHPEQDRAISLREGALLQTFPATYRFEPPGIKSSAARIGKLIGNAVPPTLAKQIGASIREHLRRVAC